MGPRFASLRRPNVVVMAPALTDARQTQNLKLTPRTISPESNVSSNKLTNGKHFDNIVSDKDLRTEGQNNNSSLVNQCVNGDSRNTENITQSWNSAKLQTLELSNGSLSKPKNNRESQENCKGVKCFQDASEYGLLHIGGFMMNNSPSMGDLDGNMGLNKSETESLNVMKEKNCCTTDVDQLFKNFQNVDEILQVIKSMDSNCTEGEGDMVSMDPGPSNESESIFPISDSTDIASDLFTDVDMMNICVDDNLGDNSLVVVNKETTIKDKLEDAERKQHHTERKLQRLLRRLRKVQVRTIGNHASEEVTGVLEHLNKMVTVPDCSSLVGTSKQHSSLCCGKSVCEKDCRFSQRKTVNDIRLLMRKLEQASQQQALAAHRHGKSYRYFGSGSRDSAAGSSLNSANGLKSTALTGSIVPKLSERVKSEVEQVAGNLHVQLKMVEDGFDSDVTASSSGGESCDEMQTYNNQHQQNVTISKRAAWRWAVDRAEVASRWAWLSAQVADLEYKIRTTTEIHRQIRAAKGCVVLQGEDLVVVNGYHGGGEPSNSSRTRPLVRSLFGKRKLMQTEGLHLVSKKAARPSTIRCGCRPPLPPCALCTGKTDPTYPRDQPDLMTVNERIALLDPAYHPVLSFPSDVSQSIHFEALMRNPEWQQKQKSSRNHPKQHRPLESSSHVPDSLLDRRTGLKRPVPTNTTAPTSSSSSSTSSTTLEHPHKKYTSGLKKSTANTLSEKIKRKLARGRKAKAMRDPNNHTLNNRLHTRKKVLRIPDMHNDELDGLGLDEHCSIDSSGSHMMNNSNHPSPAPSPTPLSAGSKEYARRKRENSYDIDNIVIPYSVASATRLEKLQYKEILTPKWRFLEIEPLYVNKLETKNNGVVRIRRSSQESDVEDLTDEVLIARHDRCEVEEKKKFSTYLKLPNSFSRARGHRRADSRAESSGANTPDPMSPNTVELKESGSPITSPPATPLPTVPENEGVLLTSTYAPIPISTAAPSPSVLPLSMSSGLMTEYISRPGPGRRRTISLSRLATPREKDDTRPNTPTSFETAEIVLPFEPRTFPLPDEVYESMLKDMPPGHPFKVTPSIRSSNSVSQNKDYELESDEVAEGDSRPLTPLSDSTESAIEEDPNDPEWTVGTPSLERLPSKR